MCPDIVAEEIFKVYGSGDSEVQALRGLSMRVSSGQLVSVIGPSGSGKTTLLNILGGLDKPTGGHAKIANDEISQMTPSRLLEYRLHNIGHILQTNNLLPYLTAEENIQLPMIAAGLPAAIRKERTKDLLKTVGLNNRASHTPDKLSGGERQRVSIASSLANNPPVLLADEPTGELDTSNAASIITLLSSICKKDNKTMILVTHDPKVAQATDLIHLIEDGRIRATMMPSQALSRNFLYVEGLRARITEIDDQITRLDSNFRKGSMEAAEYAERRHNLQQARKSLQNELHKQGIVD